jgi:hypothetical protein
MHHVDAGCDLTPGDYRLSPFDIAGAAALCCAARASATGGMSTLAAVRSIDLRALVCFLMMDEKTI